MYVCMYVSIYVCDQLAPKWLLSCYDEGILSQI